MNKLIEHIINEKNYTISIIYDSNADRKNHINHFLELIQSNDKDNIVDLSFKQYTHNDILRSINNNRNIFLRRYSVIVDEKISTLNIPKELIHISSFLLLFKNNEIKVMKSRYYSENIYDVINFDKFIRYKKIKKIDEKRNG